MNPYIMIAVAGVIGIIIVFGLFVLFARFYRKVEQGKALIVNKMRAEPEVTFTGMIVLPIFHKAEIMDISVKTLEIDRRGKDGLICRDNIRGDIKVTFFVRVNKTAEDVIKVAQAIGCARASDPHTLEELFNAKFSEALKTVGKQLDFVDLYTKRNEFRDRIVEVIGRDLNGYVLEDAAIDYLEQTPLAALDPNNILDAQGIRKITELTAVEHVKTNEFQRTEQKQIKKQDVEATEAILELERQEADAKAKQTREIQTMIAREQAETERVRAEEQLKIENARIKANEEMGINRENMERQVEIAKKNRERAIAVETERVEKERALEAISRERETELQRIAKEKEIEKQKKEIADVIRERIVVDRTVAEQEEKIKELRVVEEAKRTKEAMVINAEAEAQERLVKDIKAAEAAEQAAVFRARERLVLAEAELEASDKEARAKIRMAEGTQAESAAGGLAEVKVHEAEAIAIEKKGMAEANILRERGVAEAAVVRERGVAEAMALRERATAEASVVKERGTAEASSLRERGLAEAETTREKLLAEAAGLTEKAVAMKALDDVTRAHEEFRLKLENDRLIRTQEIDANKSVAEAQARVLGDAFKNAKIDIVGGDGAFFDRVVGAIGMGKSIDGAVNHSSTLQTAFGEYLSGDRSLPDDIKELVAKSNLSSADLQNLSVAAFLTTMMAQSKGAEREKYEQLADLAKELGIDKMKVR